MENYAKFVLLLVFIFTFSLSAILILKPTSGGHWVSCCESGCDFGNCGTTMVDSTTYYCTYDGSTWAWRTNPPNEVCDDGIDNDCDQEVDCDDADCSSDPACDTTAPTGSVSHSPESPTDQDQVTFTATGSDSGSGLDKIEIYVDNNLKKTCDFNGETTEQSCSYTGGPYSAGSTHTYYAKFYDIAGNAYTTSSESFSVSGSSEVCDDGIDNDGDGKVDCNDPDCYGKEGPNGAVCCLSASGRNASVCVKDTDDGDKPLTKGTCYWGYCSATTNECTYSSSHSDECSPLGLKEWYGIYDAENNMAKCDYKFYNCDDDDCSGLASTCSGVGTATLTRSGDDYDCNDGACKKIGTKTCESYTCDSNTLCSSQTCAGTTYYCYYDNGYKWGTSYPSSETNCNDGIDNDCDGKVDSNDPDCQCKKQGETCSATSDCCSYYSEGNTCYYNPSCSSGTCQFTQDSNKPSSYYSSGSTCYYDCAVSCTDSGWERSGCSQCSLSDYCNGNVRYYNGQCTSSGCSFSTEDCDNKDSISYDTNSDTCSWEDWGCSEGSCTKDSSGSYDCDDYDQKTSGSTYVVDYEVSSSSCTLGCSDSDCCYKAAEGTCNSSTHSNCQSITIEGTTLYCTYDGSTWAWRTNPPNEVCDDGIDNDCDGKVDSNDPDCQGGAGPCCTQNGPASDKSTECVNNNCGDYPKCYNYRCYSASIEDYSFDKTTVAPGESITLTATIKNTGCNISSEQFAIVGDWHYCGSDGVCGNGDDEYKGNYEEGNYVSISKGSTGTSSVTWSIPSSWPEGKYEVYIWVLSKTIKESCGSECGTYDWDKRVSIAKTKEINISQPQADTTPPTTTISPNGKDWTNSDVSFTLSCSDDSGCQETKYSIIDASNSCPSYNSLSKTGTSGTVSCSANSVCQKAVCYASKDKAGNTESVHKSNAFKIDKKDPTGSVSHSPESPTDQDQVTFTATGSDSGSGLDKIEIYVDNNLKKTCDFNGETTEQSCSYTGGPYSAGSTHTYYAKFYDIAGNAYTTSSESFSVSSSCVRANPSVSISPSSQSGNPGDTLTYTVTVTNNDNSACGSSTFDLSVINCPSGWTCSLADNSLTISSGSSKSTTISVTSSSSASSNTYVITVKAENSADTTYYGSEDLEYKVVPNTYTLTVYTQVDVLATNLDGVKVTIDGNDYYSSNGKITVQLTSGSHTIKAYNLADRDFSHFYDHDANADCNQNDPKDTATNPYTFTMNSCDRDITVWYKVKTKIEDLTYEGSKITGKLLMENDNPIPSRFSDDHRKVKLYYSTDNGNTWIYITTVTASSSDGSFSYSWSKNGVTNVRAKYQDGGSPNWYFMSSEKRWDASCTNNCTNEGERWCSGNKIYECGNCDGDTCLDACPIKTCDTSASDTDDGDDKWKRGTCTDYTGCNNGVCTKAQYSDICVRSDRLKEYYPRWETCTYRYYSGRCENGKIVCDFDKKCEGPYENQEKCSEDCKTTVYVEPKRVYPGQNMTIRLDFWDGRFVLSHDVSLNLTIDGKTWDDTYCFINQHKFSEFQCKGVNHCEGRHKGYYYKIVQDNYHVWMKFECTLPKDLPPGTHTIKATPIIWSPEIRLQPAFAKIEIPQITTQESEFISKIIEFFQSLLGSLFKLPIKG